MKYHLQPQFRFHGKAVIIAALTTAKNRRGSGEGGASVTQDPQQGSQL